MIWDQTVLRLLQLDILAKRSLQLHSSLMLPQNQNKLLLTQSQKSTFQVFILFPFLTFSEIGLKFNPFILGNGLRIERSLAFLVNFSFLEAMGRRKANPGIAILTAGML